MRITDDASLQPTAILDYLSAPVQTIVRQLNGARAPTIAYLQAAHRYVRAEVAPVYTIDELQPTSVTLAKRRGSCSQRFACLESLARAAGIPTRVRGLWIAGTFWAPRFRFTKAFIPGRILLAWPQFAIGREWVGVESLFGSPEAVAERNPRQFTNDGESLFDAVDHVAIDFTGRTAACGAGQCDLSRFTVGEVGTFASRDDLFTATPLLQRTFRGRAFEFVYGGRKSV